MADTHDTLSVDVVRRFPNGPTVAPSFDVSLPAGSILVLFGPSGAGKSTVLRVLAGLDRPQRGRLRFHGDTWFDGEAGTWVSPQARKVGLVTQAPTLFPHLTVRENIAYGAPRTATTGRRVEDLADTCQVAGLLDRRPRELSGGQYQRVALARAMARQPRLMLLDEPFASLDVPARSRLRGDLRSLLRRWGVPTVLVTHDRNDALALGDQMAVIAGGVVKQIGNTADVFSRPLDVDVADALGVETIIPAVVETVDASVALLRVGDQVLRAAAIDGLAAGTHVFACIRAEDVVLERGSTGATSARNRLDASVSSVVSEGVVDRVTLDCGFVLNAMVTRQAREELDITVGSRVVAVLKATAVHVVVRDQARPEAEELVSRADERMLC